jgi:hypothetical protein
MITLRRTTRRLGWILAVLAILVGTATAAWRWFGPAGDRLESARRAYQRGDWRLAEDEARRRLKTAGDDAEALRLLARSAIRLNRDDVGNAIYKDRLGRERMQAEDYFLVGLSLARLGRDETAMQVWEKAAALGAGPEHPELLEALARQSLMLGRPDQADAVARRLARLPGQEGAGWLLSGQARYELDDLTAAAAALDQGLRVARHDPRQLAAERRLLARCWLQLGRPTEAHTVLQQALSENGHDTVGSDHEAQWLLSRAWLQEGRIPEAEAALGRAGLFRDEHPLMTDPGPYLGAARCAECHPDETRTYQRTRHARTFHHGAGISALPIPDGPLPDPDDPGVRVTFRRDGPRIRVETRTKDEVFDAVVNYAFGTPERYITMIGRGEGGDFRAVRLSYYRTPEGSGWGRTSGDVGAPDPHETIRGRSIQVRDGVVRCLACHVTRPREFREPRPAVAGPESADPAIGCERCHGPGSNHVAAVAANLADRAIAIARTGAAPAATINAQCTECHIVDSQDAIRAAPEDSRYVRSPGLTLTFSRCYTESDRDRSGLTCLTCHDPHREAESTAAFYETKCLSCHSANRAGAASRPPAGRGAVCKINPRQGCLACHMPKVPVPDLQATLTDHFIRVHRRSDPGPSE